MSPTPSRPPALGYQATNRRAFLAGALASPLLLAARVEAQALIFVGDMHFHSFFGGSKYHSRPVAQALAAGGAVLVSWSLGGDILWFDSKTYKQKSVPQPGEPFGWFQRELGRIKTHIAEQNLKIVRSASDVERALRGEPHIVLSVEGASFLEDDPGRVKVAYDLGLRHLQLVHYTRNTLGDFQTESPEHNGLTEVGKQVVRECNRLGILVDLAHCTEATARDALSVSRAPVVWSHGSVTRGPVAPPSAQVWRRRQLSLDVAREIAHKGGVVGVWALAPDVGKTVEAYGERIAQLAEWLGEDHVAFGTDMNGLAMFSVVSGYAEVRRIVEHWQRQRHPEPRIRKLAIGNYARVLKAALQPG
jgi:membrane dipeptidase